MSLLTDVSDRFKAELAADDAAANARLAQSYAAAYQRLQTEVDRVATKIQRARDRGEQPDVAWLFRVGRLADLQAQAAGEMGRYGMDATRQITSAQNTLVDRAGSDAEELVRTSLGDPAKPAWLRVGWNRVPTDTLTDLVGNLSDGSPLSDLFNTYGPRAAETLKQTLVTGVAMGRNPRVIAADFRENMGGDMTRALVVARTESLRSYREASRRNYHTNSDVVNGWVWLASLTARTCPMCWAMNGTHHGNEETLDGHPCCRCSMVPDTKSLAELGLPEDEEWPANDIPLGSTVFDAQPDQVQLDVLGPTNFRLYKEGRVRLEDFVGRKENEVWGSMRYTLSSGRALAKAAATDNPLQAGLKELDPEAFKARKAAQTRVFHLRKKLAAEGWDKDAIEQEVRKRIPEAFEATKPAPGIVTPPIKPEPPPVTPEPPPTPSETFDYGINKTFEERKAADARLAEWAKPYDEWAKTLTTEERDKLGDYRREGYKYLNGAIRRDKLDDLDRQQIAAMDAAMGHTSTPTAVQLWRGVFGGPLANEDLATLPDTVFTDKAYGSWSVSRKVAGSFLDDFNTTDPHATLISVVLPEGHQAIYADAIMPNGEREMLLPRGMQYRVKEAAFDNELGVRRVTLEVVPQDGAPPPVNPKPPTPPLPPSKPGFKQLNTKAEVDAWGKPRLDALRKDTTDAEKQALLDYTGNKYVYVNRTLRYADAPEGCKALANPIIEKLDAIMAKNALDEGVVTYRGIQGAEWISKFDVLKPGEVIEDLGFQSTSVLEEMSRGWVAGQPDAVLMEIRCQAGTRAVFLEGDLSASPDQTELLLNRGQKMRVIETKTENGLRHIVVEVVQQGEEAKPPIIVPPDITPPPPPPLPPAPGNLKPVKGGVLIIDPADPAGINDPAEIKRLKRNAYSRAYKMNERLLAEGKSPEEAAAIVRKMVPEAFGGTGVINPDPVIVPPGPKPVIEPPPPIKPTIVPPPPPPVEPAPPIEPPKPTPRLAKKNISKMSFVKQNELIADLAKMGYTPDEIAESLGVTVDRVQRLVDAVKRNEEFDAAEKAQEVKDRAEKAAGRPKPVMTGQEAVDHLDKTLDAYKVERTDATKARQEVVDKLTELSRQRMAAKPGTLQSDVLDQQWNEHILRRNHWDEVLADVKKREKDESLGVLFPEDREAATFKTFVDVSSIKGPDRGRVEREIDKGAEWVRKTIGKGRLDSDTVNFDKADAGQRANYDHRMRTVKVEKDTDATVVAHELGHWLESMERPTRKAAHEFMARRTAGETAQSLKKLTGLRYGASEVAKPDKFIKPYMGKIYISGDTEIVSMGFELMMKDPIDFYRKDKDMFAFIYDIIMGAHL